jgi:hypothetical protein
VYNLTIVTLTDTNLITLFVDTTSYNPVKITYDYNYFKRE